MSENSVLYETDGHVALIVLNRPKSMNASSRSLRSGMLDAMAKAEADDNIRVVVITGEGRGFSAGADLTEPHSDYRENVTEHILLDHKPVIDAISSSTKCYIAALNGATAGISVGYALSCDLIMMAESAYIYSPFAAISLIPDGGVSWYLLKALGYQRAYQMIVECGRLTAAECLDVGIANKVVPDTKIRDAALAWAKDLSTNVAPLSLRYAKEALRAARSATCEETIHIEAKLQHQCDQSEDFREGVGAFFAKRKPEFKGR